MSILTALGTIVGGLGLFLLAVNMMTEGLRFAGGEALRDILGKGTGTRLRGLLSGILVTAAVQSSSAVTIATIGFVNAGFMNLFQALGVIFGSNIGTTMTGWLVALIGFRFKIEVFALPLLGLGMFFSLTGQGTRRGALGEALAGFGLFFVGVDILKTAFEGLAATVDLQIFASGNVVDVVTFVVVGFVLTLLTQSSSAAIAITLSAVAGGVVPLNVAASMVIGANVGTTSTALFASIGATQNAKRVAAAHVLFNIFTAIVALSILPVMLGAINRTGSLMGLENTPVVSLAIFHTFFNVLGVAILWPFSARLVRYLSEKLRTVEEDESRSKYLDKTVGATPALALNALSLELNRISDIVQRSIHLALGKEELASQRIIADKNIVASLTLNVRNFVAGLERKNLPENITNSLQDALQLSRYYSDAINLATQITLLRKNLRNIASTETLQKIEEFLAFTAGLLDRTDLQHEAYSDENYEYIKSEVKTHYKALKQELLDAATSGTESIENTIASIEHLNQIRVMVTQLNKAARLLAELISISKSENLVSEASELSGVLKE